MSNEMTPRRGKITGKGEVRDKDGNLKGEFVLEGETDLTEEELRKELGVDKQPPSDEEEK
jgi:hypothetical protein